MASGVLAGLPGLKLVRAGGPKRNSMKLSGLSSSRLRNSEVEQLAAFKLHSGSRSVWMRSTKFDDILA